MNVNIEDLGTVKKKLTVEVPAETVKSEFEQTLNVLRKQARLKGFRPGKVPKDIVRKMFGAHIEQEVAQKLINDALPDALEKVESKMASQPMLEESEFKEGEPFTFSVTFEVIPEIEVSGYEGLDVTREKINIADEMVDKRLDELRQAYATSQSIETDRPAKKGDLAVIDYTAYDGDEPIEGAANPNFQLEVGSGNFNPIFEEELIGMAKGEDKEITVAFPEGHYNPKLAGKETRFQVKLVDIKEKIIPELNDEFAKDLGQEIETMDQLKEKLVDDMTAAEDRRIEQDVHGQVRDKLLELVEFDVPENMVARETEAMVNNTVFNLKRSGLSIEAMGFSEDKLRDDCRPEAEKRVRMALILEKIAADKDIEVMDEDVEENMAKMAADTGQSVDVVREIYNKNNMMESMKDSLLTEKTLKFILDSANITEVTAAEKAEAESADAEDAE